MSFLSNISFGLDRFADQKSFLGTLVSLPLKLNWPANFWTTIRFWGIFLVIGAFAINPYFGLVVFLFCLATDAIDGLVSRRNKNEEESKLWLDLFFWLFCFDLIEEKSYKRIGEWYDPLADKVFIITCFYYFGLMQELLNPILFWLMVAVELLGRLVVIPLIRKVISKKSLHLKANKIGKIKFTVEALAGVLIMFCYLINSHWLIKTLNVLVILAIVLSIGSLLGYLWPDKFNKLGLN